MKFLRFVFASAIFVCGSLSANAQVSNPFIPDATFGKTIGSIAVRGLQKWSAVAPAAAGYLFISNGPGAVPGWQQPTGTISISGTPTVNQFAVWTSASALQGLTGGGSLFDLVSGLSTTGYVKRTGAGAYTAAPIPASDLPNVPIANGGTGQTTAGAGLDALSQLSSTGFVQRTGTASYGTISLIPIANGGTGQVTAGAALDALDGLSSIGLMSRTGTASYSIVALPLAVANGGIGTNSPSGTALDNITNFSSTGYLGRTGAGTYTFTTESQQLDSMGTPAQGQIAYRGSSSWALLSPGTAGQVLTAQGAGANPSWSSASAPPAGNRVLLNTLTASNSVSLSDLTSFTASYTEYDIEVENLVPATQGVQCGLYFAVSGVGYASSYTGTVNATNNGSSTWPYLYMSDNTNGISGSASTPPVTGIFGKWHFSHPSVSGYGNAYGQFGYKSSNVSYVITTPSGSLNTAGVIYGISINMSSGNITSGVVKIYGYN